MLSFGSQERAEEEEKEKGRQKMKSDDLAAGCSCLMLIGLAIIVVLAIVEAFYKSLLGGFIAVGLAIIMAGLAFGWIASEMGRDIGTP